MKVPLFKNKQKVLLPIIGGMILVALFVGVFYALTFIKDVFQGTVGDIGGQQGGAAKFELQKAKDLGVAVE